LALLISLILVCDRLSKIAAERALSLYESAPVIKGVFHFTLVHNTGAAFGLLKNQLVLLIATSLLAVVLMSLSLHRVRSAPPVYRIALSLIFSGALGNLIDRVFMGYVIDFIDLRVWPVFNIADSAITIGAVLLAFSILKKNTAENKAAAE
jgi:signal peptidase II